MKPEDEAELYRLSDILREIDERSNTTVLEREALRKAGFALSLAFIGGKKEEIEFLYSNPALTEKEKGKLKSYGINPD